MEYVIERNGEQIVLTQEEVEEIFQKKYKEEFLGDVYGRVAKTLGEHSDLLQNSKFLEDVAECHDLRLENGEKYWRDYWEEMDQAIYEVLPGIITLELYESLPLDPYRDYKIARDKRTCPEVLGRLSMSQNTLVRSAVAKNPNSPRWCLHELGKDGDERVSYPAQLNLERKEKKSLNEKVIEASGKVDEDKKTSRLKKEMSL